MGCIWLADAPCVRPQSDEAGTWLCPTEFDRERLLDMEERLQGARAVMFGALGVGFAISVPWLGWLPVALVAVQVVVYRLVAPVIAASARPEYPIASIVVLAQVLIAAAVALTGGPQSPLLLVFLLGIVGLPARFGTTRVVAAGVVLTEVLIFAATAGADPEGFAAHPAPAIVTAAASFGLVAFAHTLMRAESQKRSESVVDSLTGLPNRRSLEASVENLIADARDSATPLALLLCDLDLFKSINDLHGHQRGDAVLIETAQAIHRSLRPTEQVYRLGGEEFLVLIPGCNDDRARLVAERVRSAIEAAQPGGLNVTASVGWSTAAGQDIDFDELFRTADAGLYEAKHAGRNRVAHATAVAA
jgi:diguanylate cyclase (GGDEF)-like protein